MADSQVLSQEDLAILNLRMSTPVNFELESARVRSAVIDHDQLTQVLDGLRSQITRLRDQVKVIQEQKFDAQEHRETFGNTLLSESQQKQINQIVEAKCQEKSVPFEHALVLVQNLMMTQTENIELCAQIKEMRAQMQEHGIPVPVSNINQMSEPAENCQNDQSDQDEEDDSSNYSDSDSESDVKVEGANLLEQIVNLNAIAERKELGISYKQPKVKPLVNKDQSKNKLYQSAQAQTSKKFAKGKQQQTNANQNSTNNKKDEQLDKLLRVVDQAFKAQILDEPSNCQSYNSYRDESQQSQPRQQLLTTEFEKMRAHFDCLSQVESLHEGALTDAKSLREVLKKNLFLLGMESQKNKSLINEQKFHQLNLKRLVQDKVDLDEKRRSKELKLANAQAKLYDIDEDPY